MVPPAELLEQALETHGDTLYRVALLLGADERAAEGLLHRLAVAWRESPPLAPPDEPALLARLVAAHAEPSRPSRSRRSFPVRGLRGPNVPVRGLRGPNVPFRGPSGTLRGPSGSGSASLPLALHLLLGYDSARIAQVMGGDAAAARAALMAAVAARAPAFGLALPDRVSGELCQPVRNSLADPSAGASHAAVVRGHLATCALCRAFDQAWGAILQAAETELRARLRNRTLPPALAARLVAAARPTRRRISPTLRFALPPLAVLALIAALVLPGFLRPSVSVVERQPGALVDPQALIERALARHSAPPERGGVWYGRYETQWYFDDRTYAPLTAEVWLDPRNPARHRLQLTHADGGAPYELQLGNGRDRLYYALDASYAPALYGGLTTRARPDEPALLAEMLDLAGQVRARNERLATGPWSLAPAYLRQAQRAPDLRTLGRQRNGENTVQILSFSGVSPLGLPPDAPGATAQRVTVLLALDLEDGLLRSATELAGPAGAEQTSRVTWRLEQEQWLVTTDQVESAFDIGRAWTGMGDFSELGRHQSADLAMPMISTRAVGDPARLLNGVISPVPLWMPSTPPAGASRAMLLWSGGDRRNFTPPQGLIYLGDGRRLVMVFNLNSRIEGEAARVGRWDSTLRPGRGGRYTLTLRRTPEDSSAPSRFDPSANVLIDAYGYTREELLAVVASMAPFDAASLAAQDALFAGRIGAPEARAALLQVVLNGAAAPEGRARYTQARQFMRQMPREADTRRDPYHGDLYAGRPSITTVEEWVTTKPDGPARYVATTDPVGGARLTSVYLGSSQGWNSNDPSGTLQPFSTSSFPPSVRLSHVASVALDLLTISDGEPSLERLPGGALLIGHTEVSAASQRYAYLLSTDEPIPTEPYLFDLRPSFITTQLQLAPDGRPQAVRLYAESIGARRELVESYEIVEQGELPLAEAPAPLQDGLAPEAAYLVDSTNTSGEGSNILVTRTLSEALTLNTGALFLLDNATPLFVEEGPTKWRSGRTGSVLDNAVGERLAIRITYSVASQSGAPQSYYLRITQGPAGPLSAFLRSRPAVPWTSSEPLQLMIAGREVAAWLGRDESTAYLLAALDGTLLIADVPKPWYELYGPAVFDGLQAAVRP